MRYKYLDITGDQIISGVKAYEDWLKEGEPDTWANLVCSVYLAMSQVREQKITGQVEQSNLKSLAQS